MRLFGGLILGPMIGAFFGLVVATLLNENCNSFSEQLAGCRRYSVGGLTGVGAAAGCVVGVTIGAVFQLRHERRRDPS